MLSIQWKAIEPKVYYGLMYLAVASTLITFFVGQYGAVRLSPTKASAYSLLTPAFVIGLNMLVFNSAFEWATLPGVLLVGAAVVAIQRETDLKSFQEDRTFGPSEMPIASESVLLYPAPR